MLLSPLYGSGGGVNERDCHHRRTVASRMKAPFQLPLSVALSFGEAVLFSVINKMA
jgi:hypothetical protein